MYETVLSLFVGICDAIRTKDGTTETIQHQDIPDRITAIKPPSNYGLVTFTAVVPTAAEIKIS